MSGHSKWSTIKRKKGANDAKRGKLFTKLIKEITVAAKVGDPNPDHNPRLRLAVDKARSNSMPKATIDRAIAKASGDVDGEIYEELIYEGYGPGGVAVLVECLTDNRNRTASMVKLAFTKSGSSLGATGSVAYQFNHAGVFAIAADAIDEDPLLEAALEGGGEDVELAEDEWIVTCERESYDTCKKALEGLGVEILRSELTRLPDNTVEISDDDARELMKMIERLDDVDDVQETYSNASFDEEAVAAE